MTSALSRDERNHRTLSAASELQGLGRRAVHGTMISFSAQAGRMLIAIGGSAILARLLDPSDFGLMAMATAVTAFVGLFTDLGLSAATVQRQHISQDQVSTLLMLNIMVGIALMAVASLLAPFGAMFFHDDRITLLTICQALSIPITAAGAQHGALLGRAMRWLPSQMAQLLGQLVGLVAAVLLIRFCHIGYWGLAAQQLVAALISTAFLWRVCDWRPSLVFDLKGSINEIRFGAGLTSFNFINYFHRQLDNVLIGWRWNATELGYYNRAYNLFFALQSFCSGPLNGVLMPLLSRSREDARLWRENFLNAVAIIALGNGLIGTIFICCGSALVFLLYGPHWAESARILFNLSPTILISGNFALGTLFMARGDARGMLRSAILNTSLYVTGFLFAVGHGAAAMAIAYTVVTAITIPLTVHLALKDDSISQFDYYRVTLPFILSAALVIGGWFWFVPDGNSQTPALTLLIRAALLAVCYLSVASLILALDPALATLRKRVAGYLKQTNLLRSIPG